MTRPVAVVTSASPMLPASSSGFPMPPAEIFWKAPIMPLTVPRSPTMGEMAATRERKLIQKPACDSCRPTTSAIPSSILGLEFLMSSGSMWRNPARREVVNRLLWLPASCQTAAISRLRAAALICPMMSGGSIFL